MGNQHASTADTRGQLEPSDKWPAETDEVATGFGSHQFENPFSEIAIDLSRKMVSDAAHHGLPLAISQISSVISHIHISYNPYENGEGCFDFDVVLVVVVLSLITVIYVSAVASSPPSLVFFCAQ